MSACVLRGATALGINYGQVGNNLPSPPQVVRLLSSLRIGKVRIYDVNPQVMTAFANSGIELIITVPDAASQSHTLQWLTLSVPYISVSLRTSLK
jgi:hypothetical protein